MMGRLPSGTVTFVFTDIEGSTRLFQRLGDTYASVLADHHRLIRDAIAAFDGAEVRTQGDSFFVAFTDAAAAAAACVAAQGALARHTWPPGYPVRVRIGMHTGQAEATEDDYVALAVHQAARVEAAAHGGQVLVSAATAAALGTKIPVGCALVDLGEYRLKDFDEPQRLYQVRHPDLVATFPALRAPSASATNLPRARTSFIGREDVLAELHKAVADSSLVTLVGAGGLGKTRTALQVAAESMVAFPDGVWFVELAAVSDPALVVAALASALGVRPQPGGELMDAIIARLSGGTSLVVVDNCEHLADTVARTLDELLARCPDLTVLATSREPLRIADELVLRLGPMSVPDLLAATSTQALLDHESVRLFVARAARARAGFVLNDHDAPAVAAICARLDGIPLAMELAAARVGEIDPAALAAALDDRFAVLSEGLRTALPRQQTLRATFDWSYDLLEVDERVMLRRIGVFAGSFATDAVEAVATFEPITKEQVSGLLERLAECSLLDVDDTGAIPRHRLLETIRAYASERLHAAGEAPVVAEHHAGFYAQLARDCVEEGETVGALDRLEANHPNLLEALNHLSGCDRPIQHGQLVADMSSFWDLRGHWQLARRELLGYLGRADRDPALEGNFVSELGGVAYSLGDYPEARARLAEALCIVRELGERRGEGRCLRELGRVAYHLGDFPEARAYWEEALGVARELGDRRLEGHAVGGLGNLAYSLGEYPEARARIEDALGIARELGDRRLEGRCVRELGEVVVGLADYCEARARFEEALGIARELGDRRLEGHSVGGLGDVARNVGDYSEARTRFEEALRIARELGDRRLEGRWVGGLGNVASNLGEYIEARARFEEALSIARELGVRRLEAYCVGGLGTVASNLGDYPEARARFEEALVIDRELGDRRLEGRCVGSLGNVASNLGDYPEARARFDEALVIARELGNRRGEAHGVGGLATVASDLGDYPEARARFDEALVIARELGTEHSHLLVGCAQLLARLDHCEDAAQLLGAADTLNTRAQMVRAVADQARYDATIATCRDRLGEETFAPASKRGCVLDWVSAVDTALEFLGPVSRASG